MPNDHDSLNKAIAVALVTSGVILLPSGWFAYNLNQDLQSSQAKVEEMAVEEERLRQELQSSESDLDKSQLELEKVKKELEEADANLGDTQRQLDDTTRTMEERNRDLEAQRQNVEVLATCLAGVVQALSLLDRDEAEALIMLGRVESYCNESDRIIESLSSSDTSKILLIPL